MARGRVGEPIEFKDAEAERTVLADMLLRWKRSPVTGSLRPDLFYGGDGAWNGWFFGMLRSAINKKRPDIGFLLSAKARKRSAELGVDNLAYEISQLLFNPRGEPREPMSVAEAVAALLRAAEFRERADRIARAEVDVVNDWRATIAHMEAHRMSDGMVLAIPLPLPPKQLHPNYSAPATVGGKVAKSKRIKQARGDAYLAAKKAIVEQRPRGLPWKSAELEAAFTIGRRMDDDGLVAWLKAYRDGLADARIVEDDFCFHVRRPTQIHETEARLHEVVLTVRCIQTRETDDGGTAKS